MIDGTAVDTSTMLVLAAIALAEGLVRVPAGAVVLRRILNGAWQIEERAGPGDRLRLVHWWSPWTEALVVSPGSVGGVPLTRAGLISRMAAIATVRRAARIVGAATLILLVVGVPASFGLAGAIGGLWALAGVVSGQITLAILSWWGLKLLGVSRRERWRSLPANLNPFAAPAAASRLLALATAGASAITVAQTLLPSESWAKWFRPLAYDAGVAFTLDRDLAGELESAEEAVAQVLSQRPAMANDVLWCPRCASTYQAGARKCADCDITLLTASQTVAPLVGLRPAPILR
jgi:hypothetical protein